MGYTIDDLSQELSPSPSGWLEMSVPSPSGWDSAKVMIANTGRPDASEFKKDGLAPNGGMSPLGQVLMGEQATSIPSLQSAQYAGSGFCIDGTAFLCGGNIASGTTDEVWMWNVGDSAWYAAADHPETVQYAAGCSYGQYGFLFGGTRSGSLSNKVTIYDKSDNSWDDFTTMTTAAQYQCVVEVDGVAYVLGGSGSSSNVSTLKSLDLTTGSWATLASPSTALKSSVGFHHDGSLYILGGADFGGTSSDIMMIYNISGNSWSYSTVPYACQLGGVIYGGGRALHIIGYMTSRSSTTRTLYTNSLEWVASHRIPDAMYAFACIADKSGGAYICGGATASGSTNKCWYLGTKTCGLTQ